MKSKITKLAAAAVIIVAVFVGIHFLGDSFENVAFSEVLDNIKNVRTVTWQNILMDNEQIIESSKVMVLEPYLMRVEQKGTIWIRDHNQGKTLLLNIEKHEYVTSTTYQDELDEYNTLRQLLNTPEYSVRQIGYREIEGIKTVGFELTKVNDTDNMTVWVNSETSLPVRIEKTVIDSRGNILNSVTTDIVFDIDLDPDLFDFEVPSGYVDRSAERNLRFQTALNMKKILMACLMYNAIEKKWPDNLEELEELTAYGFNMDTLINPGHPEKGNGFVYIKPEPTVQEQTVVLYEAYDSWQEGINVGFGDSHIDFISSEEEFLKLLEK